ncbi:MAG: DNA repair protein RadC [Spirochaetae bacterium HGW-Spirochaetae-3]|jgi:DNA repair protein RadC|nr:MAG: DNA repair protein RadC [Spirochaetae bacterium HGW-Spirochaetae-3]
MTVKQPEDVYESVKRYKAKKQEHFLVMTLDGAHQPIKTHVVSIGLVNRTIVHPREVFYRAIKDMAAAVLLVHNHPSGQVQPSQEDRDITHRLIEAGELLGIPVLDHLIISAKSFYSFTEHGELR